MGLDDAIHDRHRHSRTLKHLRELNGREIPRGVERGADCGGAGLGILDRRADARFLALQVRDVAEWKHARHPLLGGAQSLRAVHDGLRRSHLPLCLQPPLEDRRRELVRARGKGEALRGVLVFLHLRLRDFLRQRRPARVQRLDVVGQRDTSLE